MRIQSVLLASLLLGLYGCQQQTSAPQQAEPVVELPASASAVLQAAASGPVASASAVEPVTAVSEVKVPEPVKPATPAKVEAVAAKAAPVVKVRTEKVAEKLPVSAKAVVEPVQAAPAVVAPAAAIAKVETPAAIAAVSEGDALALAKKNNCLACHAIDHKVVGPAWKDVAAKYRGNASAEAHLISKISTGGSGVWGSMKMPAHPKISEADRTILARFVLNLK
ncbi:MAG: hypothetical protein PHH47_12050 [Gallionella sp.]|nr:hypothetical protein [Gallionella sp.]MDD4947084.1 hypothetical protein [Gallionella sp.]